MISSVIVGTGASASPGRPADPAWQTATAVLGMLGLAIGTISLIDLAVAWTPFRFGNAEWEFGTVTRTLDSLALTTTALVFVLAAVLVRGLRRATLALGVVFLVIVLALAACLVLYGLNVPVALRAVPAEAAPLLERAIFRTTAFGMVYVVLYSWLGWFTWRAVRAG